MFSLHHVAISVTNVEVSRVCLHLSSVAECAPDNDEVL